MSVLPMFPLGSVLLPGGVLPLHVFEPRYRSLVRDCLDAADPEFGVVLIERGREVGGDDVRRSVGTVARMVQVAELDDGRYAIMAIGTRRIRVNAWLPDDPYPLADVDDWPDDRPYAEPSTAAPRDLSLERLYATVSARVRSSAALALELGDASNGDLSAALSEDVLVGSFQLSLLAPLGPADEYDLLCADGPRQRLEMIATRLDDVDELHRFRLGNADELPDRDGGAD